MEKRSLSAPGGEDVGQPATVAFLAVGTRGDVQPLAVLAATLAKGVGNDVHFITNRAHKTLVESPLVSAGVCSVRFLSLQTCGNVALPSVHEDEDGRRLTETEDQHREVRKCAAPVV